MRRRTQLLVCVVFLGAIAIPAIAAGAGLTHSRAIENRPLAARPPLTPSALLDVSTYAALNAYLTDRIPWRDRAVEARERVSERLFGESASDQVVAGTDGWFYLARTVQAPCIDDAQARRIATDISQLRDVMSAAGKQFRLLVVPEKETVYSQHLQARDLRGACLSANSRLFQAAVGDAGVLPGYSSVVERSRVDPALFYRTDTHWSDRGALVGAQDLVDSLQPGLFDPGAYSLTPGGDAHQGDLLRLAGTPGTEVADAVRANRPGIEVTSSDDAGSTPGVPLRREERAGGPLVPGRVLVAHDSSGFSLRPLAAPWLADGTWLTLGDDFDAAPWARAVRNADTVVLLMVERNLASLPHTLLLAARAELGG